MQTKSMKNRINKNNFLKVKRNELKNGRIKFCSLIIQREKSWKIFNNGKRLFLCPINRNLPLNQIGLAQITLSRANFRQNQ